MGILETPRQAIWTPKNNTTPIFIPLTGPLDAMDWITVLPSVWIGQSMGDVSVKIWSQYSNDGGLTWADGEALSASWVTSAGWTYGTTAVEIAGTADTIGTLVRFGLKVKNTSGTGLSYARARVRISGRAS
jgi:hypothetical protein